MHLALVEAGTFGSTMSFRSVETAAPGLVEPGDGLSERGSPSLPVGRIELKEMRTLV